MKLLTPCLTSLTLLVAGALIGCSMTSTKSVDVTENIRKSLDNANLKDVSISQDRDKGVVTLGGHVPVQADKMQAETIARSMAGEQVIANQIAVIPPGAESDAKAISSDLDKAIEKNLDAALIQAGLQKGVTSAVKNGVVTLSGEVVSDALRTQTQSVASMVPNVSQVVNTLQVKNQKASSSN